MTSRRHPFRKRDFRPHSTPELYYDADYIRLQTNGAKQLFTDAAILHWKRSAVGAQALRHPRTAFWADPLCAMLLIDGLMKVEVHSTITATPFAGFLNSLYLDYVWHPMHVGKIMTALVNSQKKVNAPLINGYYPITAKMPRGTWHFFLNPYRETYVWLAKMREAMEEEARSIINQERVKGVLVPQRLRLDAADIYLKRFPHEAENA